MDQVLIDQVLERAIAIQQIPAPTFAEGRRAQFVRQEFDREGLQDVSLDSTGNVYGRLPGAGAAPALVVSAHLDTVFPPETDLAVRRTPERIDGPGIGDNSLGVAGLFGLLWALRQKGQALPGDVWLVANVGEEGLGDLNGMKAVVERFRDDPQAGPLGYLVLEGMALGLVYHRALGVQRYRITCQCQGGHSWGDYGRPSAVHELARLVTHLEQIPRPGSPRHTLNVGVFHGGTSVNTIAAQASLELDLRSEDEEVLADMAASALHLVENANHGGQLPVKMTCELIGHRPAGELAAGHPWLDLAAKSLQAQGVEPVFTIGSTDANIPLSRGLAAVTVGLTLGGGAHTVHEFITTAPLGKGLAQVTHLVEAAFAAVTSSG